MTTVAMPRPAVTPLSVAFMTAGYLFCGIALGMAIGFVVGTPQGAFHMVRNVTAGVLALVCMTVTAVAWGRRLARSIGFADVRRAGWAGALSFGPTTVIAGLVLTFLEQRIVERGGGPALPIHIVYGMLFVAASFFVAAVSAWVIGVGLRFGAVLQLRLALTTGFAAAGAYLLVYLMMDLAGWKVGAPDAAKRATMLVVTALASLAAALAGGAGLGTVIVRRRER